MEAIVKGIKGEMAETKEFVLIHNVEELKAAEAESSSIASPTFNML